MTTTATTAKTATEMKNEINPISATMNAIANIQQAGSAKTGFERLQGIGELMGLLSVII